MKILYICRRMELMPTSYLPNLQSYKNNKQEEMNTQTWRTSTKYIALSKITGPK